MNFLSRSQLRHGRVTFLPLRRFLFTLASLWLVSCSSGSSGSGSQGTSAAPDDGGGNDTPFAVTITAPESGTTVSTEDMVQFSGEANDPQGVALSGDSLAWESDRDGALGTGTSVTVDELSLGGHNVTLAANASDGSSGSDTIFVWVAEPPGAANKRNGEFNPYARRIERLPKWRDDELVTIRNVAADDSIEFGMIADPVATYSQLFVGIQTTSDPIAPEITASDAGRVAVAADAGRISGKSIEDMALVTRSPGGSNPYRLEIISLIEAGQHLMADYSFNLPIVDSEVVILVSDLDSFNEIDDPDDPNSQYYDEVVLAYPELVGGERRATIKVLSFETAEYPVYREGPLTSAVSERSIVTTQAMHPTSQIILATGENLYVNDANYNIVVAYLNENKEIAVDVFRYIHTRDDPDQPNPATDTRSLDFARHVVLSEALSDSTAAADGWALVVEDSGRLGINNLNDILLPIWHEDGRIFQDAWNLYDESSGPNLTQLSDGAESFDFASIQIGTSTTDFVVLPDSKLQVTTGRIVNDKDDDGLHDCELTGLIVLADTNRGPTVQTLLATATGSNDWGAIGLQMQFGPALQYPNWWPGDRLNPPTTSELSNTSLVAGGLTSLRNGLLNERRGASGVSVEKCGNTAPLHGTMPSYYVAQPDLGLLYAVTEGGSSGRSIKPTYEVAVPMQSAVGEQILMLAGDMDGDAAYQDSGAICIDGQDSRNCRIYYLGHAELHYVIENLESSNVILQTPPKHIDHLPELGGLVNVSMLDGFFAEFAQTDVNSGSIERKLKSDWTSGERAGIGIGLPTPVKDKKSNFELSLDAEHQFVSEFVEASTATVSLQQTTGAIGDDVVWGKVQTIDFWRFPAQGGKTLDGRGNSQFSEDAYVEISLPEEPVTLIGPGTLNDGYQPTHHIGNILSYPTISGDVTDIGEVFGFLGGYVPADEDGDRQCQSLEDGAPGCLAEIDGVLQTIATVTAVDLASENFTLIGGDFETTAGPIDVAEVLQIGGTSYSAELEFTEEVRLGTSVTTTDKVSVEFNEKVPLIVPIPPVPGGVPVPIGTLEYQVRESAAFESSEISENTLGSKTRILLNVPGGIPTQRSYQIRPAFGFSVGGSLNLSYQVSTAGLTESFWSDNYSAPDPALNMPFRIVRGEPGARFPSNEFLLGTDSTRNRIKGFFIRNGTDVDPLDPSATVGNVLTKAPLAGDPVQLEVRVTNLSVATAAENLVVEFSAEEYIDGVPTGDTILIGGSAIPYLPYRGQFEEDANGHVKSTYVYWDTTGFGPLPGNALRTWAVHVTLDPADQIENETHELFDRYDDPLVGPAGEILDPEFEKGQNNRGWSIVRIAPALDSSANTSSQKATVGRKIAVSQEMRMVAGYTSKSDELQARLAGSSDYNLFRRVEGAVGEAVEMVVGLRAGTMVRGYGTLRVFDGDPKEGSTVLLSRKVQGVSSSEATFESFVWRPQNAGDSLLYVTYTGAGTDEEIVIPIPVRVH